MAWYDSNWSKRKLVTIDSDQVSANLTNFPVAVLITDSDLSASARSDGFDILFTDDDGTTKLDHEIEKYTSGTGVLVAWVEVPSVTSAVDKTIYMYYGYASATDQSNPTGTWDTNHKAVYHFAEDPSGTAPQILDSTSNNNDATSEGSMTSGDLVAGKAGDGLDFDGSDDALTVPHSAELDIVGDVTISYWVEFDVVNVDQIIVDKIKTPGSDPTPFTAYMQDSGGTRYHTFYHHSTGGDYSSALTFAFASAASTSWTHVAFVRDATGETVDLYLNGTQAQQLTYSADDPEASADTMYIGSDTTSGRHLNGILDELRISNTQRSAAWIAAEYNSVQNAGTFLTFGAEEDRVKVTDAESGTYAVSGNIAGPVVSVPINPGSYLSTGVSSQFQMESDAAPGSYVSNGVALSSEMSLLAQTGSYLLSGVQSDVIASYILDAEIGPYINSGLNADLIAAYLIDNNTGTYGLSGVVSDLLAGYSTHAEFGVYILTGVDADLVEVIQNVLNAEAGSYLASGVPLAPVLLTPITAGGYVVNGIAQTPALLLVAEPGSHVINGVNTSAILSMLGVTGSYLVTGIDAELLGISQNSLNAEPGGYLISGVAASLLGQYLINSQAGAYTLSGAAMAPVIVQEALTGQYLSTGIDAAVLAQYLDSMQTGSYTLSGIDGDLLTLFALDASTGSYLVSGLDADLLATYIESLLTGACAMSGVNANLVYSALTIPDVVRLSNVAVKSAKLGSIVVAP